MNELESYENVDFIIIGQGLAGTLLAQMLIEKKQRVVIFDNYHAGSASRIAAGVINPITGRRIVKSWRVDEFLPFARVFYQNLEKKMGMTIWHDREIIRTLANAEAENEWLLRSNWAEYVDFCGGTCGQNEVDTFFNQNIRPFFNYATIKQAAQVDVPQIVQFFQSKWLYEGILHQAKIDADEFEIQENHVFYKKYAASKVIFCEGARGADNPFFGWLPFNLDKGESLIVRIEGEPSERIFKNTLSIVPLAEKNTYWVGATNEWNSPHDLPTDAKKEAMVQELKEILAVDFIVLAHHAAIRPTVKDRRPMLGTHPNFLTLGFFNGFGTKGASLIPFWAHHFVNHLLEGKKLDDSVSIGRFL